MLDAGKPPYGFAYTWDGIYGIHHIFSRGRSIECWNRHNPVTTPTHMGCRLLRSGTMSAKKSLLRAFSVCCFTCVALGTSLQSVHASAPATYWVAPSGSNSNACTQSEPCLTIGYVLQNKASDGDSVMVEPGVYREQLTIFHKDLTIEGTGDGVFLFGSLVPSLTAAEGMYKAAWPWGVSFQSASNCNTLTADVALPAEACNTLGFWQDQVRLDQVYDKASVTAGTFYYDFATSELWLMPVDGSPDLSQIEGLAYEYVVKLTSASERVTLKNLNIWYGASKPDDGILQVQGLGHTLEDLSVRYSAGAGILVYGADQVTMNNVQAFDHGQNGWRVRANVSFSGTEGWILNDTVDDLVLLGSGSRRNGWKGYDNCWAGGATKFSFTQNLTIDGFYSADNNGPGIWLDIENDGYAVRNSMSARDAGRGIFIEYVSDHGVVENNVIFATRDANPVGCSTTHGLVVSDSRNVLVSNNTVYTTDPNVKGMELKTGCATCRTFPYPSEYVTWQDNLIVNKASAGFVRDLKEGTLDTFTFIGTAVEEQYSGDTSKFVCWDSLGSCNSTALGIETLPPGVYLEDELSECGFTTTSAAVLGKGAQGFVHPRAVEVCGSEPPAASFNAATSSLQVSFTDTSIDDGSIMSWSWDFGNGNSSSQQHPVYSYPSAGAYTVKLTVTDDEGLTGVASQEITVEDDSCTGLCVDIWANAASFSTGDTISVSLQAINVGGSGSVDFYTGVILPDGNNVRLFTSFDLAFVKVTKSDLSVWTPIVAGVALANPFSTTKTNFLSHLWTGTEPAGTYVFFLAAVVPGGLLDGVADVGDVIAIDTVPVTFTP